MGGEFSPACDSRLAVHSHSSRFTRAFVFPTLRGLSGASLCECGLSRGGGGGGGRAFVQQGLSSILSTAHGKEHTRVSAHVTLTPVMCVKLH